MGSDLCVGFKELDDFQTSRKISEIRDELNKICRGLDTDSNCLFDILIYQYKSIFYPNRVINNNNCFGKIEKWHLINIIIAEMNRIIQIFSPFSTESILLLC